jgi:peptidoglycan/xylan/chitin deacetylase (PgdA/CDA1 family)
MTVAGLKPTIIRGGLESLYFTGAHLLLRPIFGGVGAILTMHHVRPPRPDRFQPNRLLEVTPRFLAGVIRDIRRSGLDLVSLDELHRRLSEGDFSRRFVCLTFDDGYRDILQWAYPILKEAGAPFAVYVATSFPDRLGELWWLVLEAVIARNDRVGLVIEGRDRIFDCATVAQKRALYDELYWWLRGQPSEIELRSVVRSLAAFYHVDVAAYCSDLCMSWAELAGLAADPLVTIGAHTVNHLMLAKLPKEAARAEMELSASVIEAALSVRPQHLSYPYGDPGSAGAREFEIATGLGFKTAVTTRPGVLFPKHGRHLTALPRISLNGDYQRRRYVRVLLSGSATAMWNGFRRVEAA